MSLRRKVLAEITIQPSPSVAASSSADTTVENAAASAICIPVRIIGAADGSTTWRNTAAHWLAPERLRHLDALPLHPPHAGRRTPRR